MTRANADIAMIRIRKDAAAMVTCGLMSDRWRGVLRLAASVTPKPPGRCRPVIGACYATHTRLRNARSQGFPIACCTAYVRRKFYDILIFAAKMMLPVPRQIKALYAKDALREQSADPVVYRDHHSRLLMEAMLERLQRDQQVLDEHNRAPVPPKRSVTHQAMGRAVIGSPQASIDNNRAEQAIRPTKSSEELLFAGILKSEAQRNPPRSPELKRRHRSPDLSDRCSTLPNCGSDPHAARTQPKHWKQQQAQSGGTSDAY